MKIKIKKPAPLRTGTVKPFSLRDMQRAKTNLMDRRQGMNGRSLGEAFIMGLFVCIGLSVLGFSLYTGIVYFKTIDRTVAVKGLSEREVPADIAIWPIKFSEAGNDLNELYGAIQSKTGIIVGFLKQKGFSDDEITVSAPAITDKQTEGSGTEAYKYRYTGKAVITVYSKKVDAVRKAAQGLVELGQQGIVLAGEDYASKTEFLFTRLNELKPAMIEEATRNAREVAVKFAKDSESRLGKIKNASQGQFSIEDRDSTTTFIKKVRVVATVEYYLSD